MPIIYRSDKGSELTSDEVDGNFQFLDEEKQDNLTFDTTPTEGSNNPVTSDGIFTFVNDAIGDLSGFVAESTLLNINGVSQDLSANRSWRTGLADTGALEYLGISIASGTEVNIGACTGIIVDNETTPGVPTYQAVSYAGETNKTVTTIGSGTATYVLLKMVAGVPTIHFQNTQPTSSERKSMIYLSKLSHPSGTVLTLAVDEVDFITSPLQQFRDLFQAFNYINLGLAATANASLTFQTNTAKILGDGINFVTDKTIPNHQTIGAQNPCSFLYLNQSGPATGPGTALDPTTYDVAGVTTTIPGSSNQATIQYLYYSPGVGYGMQRGQTIYATITDAIAAVNRETYTVRANLVTNAIRIGAWVVTKGCTNLQTTTTARFFPADMFGQLGGSSSGISVATLQTAYNNSLVPQITTTTALGAVTFRRGSSADTDTVFTIQNGAGSTTASINGNGLFTGSAIIANGTGGAGYLQLVSQSAPPAAVNGSMILYTDSSTRFSMVRRNIANSADITRTLIFNDATVVYTFPSQNTDTLAGLGSAQSFTAAQTFTGNVIIAGTNTNILQFQNNGGTPATVFESTASNQLRFCTGFSTLAVQSATVNWQGSGGVTMNTNSNSALTINTGQTSASGLTVNKSGAMTTNTTAFKVLEVSGSYTPTTSGAGTLQSVLISTTINQTLAANQDVTFFDLNPTITNFLGTNLYGIRSRIASGTGRWNLVVDGTAPNKLGVTNYFGNITAGSNLTDSAQIYATDIVAGNSAIHAKCENGDVVRLYSDGGWTKMTGTSQKGTFDTATVTLPQLAGKVMALEAMLYDNLQVIKA